MRKTLEELCLIPGVSSQEDAVRDYITEKARPHANSIRVDAMGNLIVFKKGAKESGQPLMLAAHMDEVGLMVRSITDEGYLKFFAVGGIDRRVLIGKQVFVGKEQIPGIVGLKAFHLVSRDEGKKIPKLSEFYIDIGAENGEEAKSLVSPGDVVSFERGCQVFGNGLFQSPAIDDRIGCAVMLELLRKPLPVDCTFVFTVQEEVGTRGAFGAAFSVKPDIALVLEGTTAADIPAMEDHQKVCVTGQGPVISFVDGTTVYDRALFEQIRDLAIARKIPWQVKHYIAGGTDASAIQKTRDGVRVAGIAAPVRYLHTASTVVSLQDCEHMTALAYGFLEALGAQY